LLQIEEFNQYFDGAHMIRKEQIDLNKIILQ